MRQGIRRYRRYVLRGFAIALISLGLMIGPGWSQETTKEAVPAPVPKSGSPANELLSDSPVTRPLQTLTPPSIREIFRPAGDINTDIAAVNLDGREVFKVAAPAEQGALTATERSIEIEERLYAIARNFINPSTLEQLNLSSQIDQDSQQPVIYINDEYLMTVTYLDARLNGVNSLQLRATQIVDAVEEALNRFSQERQPEFLWQQVRWSLATLLIVVLGHCAIAHFHHSLTQRRQQLKRRQDSGSPPDLAIDTAVPITAGNRIQDTLLLRQKINSLTVLKQLLRLLQILLWIAGGLAVLGYFPYTRWLQPLAIGIMRLPLRFFIVGLIAYGFIRFSSIWIDRLFLVFQNRTAATIERSQRLVLRLSTFSQVIKGIVAFVIGSIAFLVMLSLLGVRVAPLLAGAGLLGFAISFASQSLIKDIINGFLVLLEDQYGVGDVITIKDMSGFVENMNLRITQLRATDGQLITIPNGQIDVVQNLSKEWSRVDLMVPVGLAADIDQALSLVERVANDMRQDAIWGGLILEPPLLLGVDELSHAGATIRIWIKTLPMKQWDVAREYRRRLKIAFERAHIPVGVPQQMIYVSGSSEQAGTMPPHRESTNGSMVERSPTPNHVPTPPPS